MAVSAGLAVANVYAVQPLLDLIGASFSMKVASLGQAVTLTQMGYAIGLILLVPLGDLLDRRRLIIGQTGLSALVLAGVAVSGSPTLFLMTLAAAGVLAVTVQTLVAFAGALASPDQRGAVVGKVTGGVVIGILAARVVSGSLGDLIGWRAIYVISAGLCLASALTLSVALPQDPGRSTNRSYGAILQSLPTLLLRDTVLQFRAALACVIFAAFSVFWTPLVFALTAEPFQLSHTQIGLFGLIGIAGTIGARGAGRLVDRGRERWVTGTALALLCLSWAFIMLLPRSLWWLAVGIVLLDLAVQAVHVTNQTLIVGRQPDAAGHIIAGYMVFYSVGSAAGGAASTYVYSLWGWNGVCLTGFCISIAGLALWIYVAISRAPAH
jgi:predicted MFS family arabinose efflux permease